MINALGNNNGKVYIIGKTGDNISPNVERIVVTNKILCFGWMNSPQKPTVFSVSLSLALSFPLFSYE